MDVEMGEARKSARLALKEQTKLSVIIPEQAVHFDVPKLKRKGQKPKQSLKALKPMKKSIARPMKVARKKVLREKKTMLNKFADLSKTKISDLFCLVRKYATCDTDRQLKYLILQTTLKGMKELDINNLFKDLKQEKLKVTNFVTSKLRLLDVMQHLEQITSYKEVDDDEKITTESVESAESVSMTDAEIAVRESINTLDDLDSLFRRLLV